MRMIVSRSSELARLDDVLAALRRGQGTALVVRGEAGIGKTTLLDALVERAGNDTLVLRACGAESEVELAFSALTDLLHPVLGKLGQLPPLQAAALSGALALGPPLPGDRLAVCVATLGLLRAAAARRAVLVVLDDVQWVDASSRECVEYVARRAGGPLAVVLAARDALYASASVRLPELALAPLDEAGAAELLRERAPGLAPPVAAAVTEAAAGNPLALLELPAMLTAEQRAGVAALELPLAAGGHLQHAFAGRVDTLAPPTQRALLIAAVHARGRVGRDRSRLSACGVTPNPHPVIREEGGTPDIIGSIRAGLVFALKEQVGAEEIRRREQDFAPCVALVGRESQDRDPRQDVGRAAADRDVRIAPPAAAAPLGLRRHVAQRPVRDPGA
jgi:AAA ATPase-like protein